MLVDNRKHMNSIENANNENHYKLITVAILIGLVGIYFRFIPEPGEGHLFFYNCVANVILIIATAIALKGVFAILK